MKTKGSAKKILNSKTLFWIVLIAIIVVAISIGVALIEKRTGFFGRLFQFDVNIDKTDNVVEQIQATAELTTACFIDEFVLYYTKDNAVTKSSVNKFLQENLNTSVASKDRMVLICKGKARAGFDLKKVTEADVKVSGDTLNIVLPEPEYFDLVINPSDFEYFDRTGKWSHKQETQVKQAAIKRLKADAESKGLLKRAETIGLQRLQTMYKTLGFSVVNLTIKGR